MDKKYRIVFNGAIVDGFDPVVVKQAAANRLKLDGSAVEKVFSGRRAVLKKNLDQATAERYLGALRQIGMQARAEEQPALVASPAPDVRQSTFDALATITNPLVLADEPIAPLASEPVVEFDPHKTHINLARAEELLNRVASGAAEEYPTLAAVSRLESECNVPQPVVPAPVMTSTQAGSIPTPVVVQLVSESAEKVLAAEPRVVVAASASAVRASVEQTCTEPCCPRCGEDLSVLLELYMQDAIQTRPHVRESNRGAERGWLHSVWGWLRPRAA